MLAALAEGKLSHLAGEGQPLPEAPPSAFIDPGEAVGMRLLAEAGYLPREIELRRQLADRRAAWRQAERPADKKALMAEIADLEMREAMAREARLKLLSHHH